ncbi:Nitronate monooxygenase [Purpureocillium takamizusanense]|uniref:Nitronate monooxygenase n=1 Tax=Purpureocillium takamizusanense TaxID=2060973 RepID=A0A9Q8QJ44_9HYPO|nr:Nitronate monooxygenase [Purpureocillium takamizusanense]UNI20650.1 Nitronate monooxygenase [Purpureocillium takamizusanense]
MATPRRLQEWFPWTASPIVCNGPMFGAASPALATEVTKAGGIGFLASVFDLSPNSPQLDKLDAELREARTLLGDDNDDGGDLLGVGVSVITGHGSVSHFASTTLPILARHRPAAVWLFAPAEHVKPHGAIIAAVRRELGDPGHGGPRVFVQVGNVAAAREAVRDGADVLVCQGVDAGGHQFTRGAGVVSLVPEVRRMLAEEEEEEAGGLPGRGGVAILAAGGIADETGVAAAMALGAEGVVMGTRFTVAKESIYPDFRKKIVLETSDGGATTLKSTFNDRINDSPLWRPPYDGRAIVTAIHERFLAGASLEDCQRSLKEDYAAEDSAKLIGTWAGTGVGLVRTAQAAGDIVREVREGAKEQIRRLAASL